MEITENIENEAEAARSPGEVKKRFANCGIRQSAPSTGSCL